MTGDDDARQSKRVAGGVKEVGQSGHGSGTVRFQVRFQVSSAGRVTDKSVMYRLRDGGWAAGGRGCGCGGRRASVR